MKIRSFFTFLIITALTAAAQSKPEMAHYILRNLPGGEVYRNAFSMLEADAKGTPGWHEALFGTCKAIYSQDSIPDDDLSFAELTLESLASSAQTSDELVFNSSSILGNIAFNARDYNYLTQNISRMEQAAGKLGNSAQLQAAISKLRDRKEMIKGYEVPFRERLQGTWVSAEVDYKREPTMFLDIMGDSIRINPYKEFTYVEYDKEGNLKEKFRHPEYGTKEIVVLPEQRQVAAFFGYSQLDKGNPMLASAIAAASEQWSGAMTRSAAYRNRKNPYSVGASLSSFTSSAVGMLGMALAASLSESVKYTELNNIYLTEIVPGIVRMDREYVLIKESSQEGRSEYHYPQSVYLYRITAADSLAFAHYSDKKYKQPYEKDMCGVPFNVENVDAYLNVLNSNMADSIAKHREELDKRFKSLKYSYNEGERRAAAYSNYFMGDKLAKVILKRLAETPEGLIDDRTQLEIFRDVRYGLNNQDVFDDMVKVDGFEGRDNAWFSGVYSNKCDISYWNRPKMLLQLLTMESKLPNGEPVFWRADMDNVADDLQKNIYPVNGVMTWEKKGKQYRYEGEFRDRKFHGNGKFTEDGVVVHEGEFENGKPLVSAVK